MTTLDEATAVPRGQASESTAPEWKQSACILCECNCGIEIRLGADGRTFERIRGDKDHPASQGYTCEKALRLDHYQNGRGERVLHPLRRRDRRHVRGGRLGHRDPRGRRAARRGARRPTAATRSSTTAAAGRATTSAARTAPRCTRAFGGRYRSSAIAQEKSGEVWVNGRCSATPVRGEFDECEVAFFVGKNPWMSHGIPHARTTLKAIANDPDRSMVVIDPRVTETAELADFHLQVAPGRDAWLLAAMVAVIVQERLDRRRLAGRARQRPRRGRRALRDGRRSPSTARSPASTRTSCGAPPGASPRRPASPCSRTSACR